MLFRNVRFVSCVIFFKHYFVTYMSFLEERILYSVFRTIGWERSVIASSSLKEKEKRNFYKLTDSVLAFCKCEKHELILYSLRVTVNFQPIRHYPLITSHLKMRERIHRVSHSVKGGGVGLTCDVRIKIYKQTDSHCLQAGWIKFIKMYIFRLNFNSLKWERRRSWQFYGTCFSK